MEIITTFPRGLRYACTPESCFTCCSLLEDIPVSIEEINRVKALGYRDFYEARSGRYFIKKPCVFLEDKLCSLHREHGKSGKFMSCRKYPFSASVLDNGSVVVDVKWTCPGVGFDTGEEITEALLREEFLDDLLKRKAEEIKRGEVVYLHNPSRQQIPWRALVRLHSGIVETLAGEGFYDFVLLLTAAVRHLGSSLGGRSFVSSQEAEEALQSFRARYRRERGEMLREVKAQAQVAVDILTIYDYFDELFQYRINPGFAAKKLEIAEELDFDEDFAALFSKPLSGDAQRLLAAHARQSFMETLARPWDLPSAYFWTLGVACVADYLARLLSGEEVTRDDARKALSIVDFLNKHFRSFRDYYFPKYPELGMQYLQFLLGGVLE
ncbi:MAG: YkgJ family cysteine cluster protein [Euryarchaeota archaeon]|nr:YkgJ family cysteine cluster protein [Euryarchaeota archaeon]